MKRSAWRWVIIPAGIEYAKGNYVSKDRKFIEGEIIKDKKKNDDEA
jgi:hypothetical protein